MKLKSVRIRNFRCFVNETTINFQNFTALVGKNDVGKSAVLDAIGLFFGEYNLDPDDASINGNKSDVAIICEFCELPSELVIDADYKVIPESEYILNAQGNLEIHRIFNGALQKPKLIRTFLVAQHPSADGYSDLLYLKNKQLKERAQELGVDLTDVDLRINSELRQAIWKSASDLLVSNQEIDIEKEDAKKLWGILSKQLPIFALFHSDRKSSDQDEEAQNPLKSAVDEALAAQEQKLNEITDFVRSRVLSIANETVKKLSEMDSSLAQELNPRFSKPNWAKVFGISLTDDSQIPINKRGSGVRRLILLNFFRAQAEKRLTNSDAPGIIYAIEEPETSQHPYNQELLLKAFLELSDQPGCQVFITTHTPVLVRDLTLPSLSFISKENTGAHIILQNEDLTYIKIASSLGVIPDHRVKLFIGVEGINDIDFLCRISKILFTAGENILDLEDLESQGKIIFIPLGGSNLRLWAHRLAGLNCYEYHIFDRDDQPPQRSCHQDVVDEINRRGAKAILTNKREMENYIHPDAIRTALGISIISGDFVDVPALVAEQFHITSGSPVSWLSLDNEKRRKKISSAKRRLNTEAVEKMTPTLLTSIDPNSDVRNWLNEIRSIIES